MSTRKLGKGDQIVRNSVLITDRQTERQVHCNYFAEDDRGFDEAISLTHVILIIVNVFDASPSSVSSILGSLPTRATDL